MTSRTMNPRISDPGAFARATGAVHTPVEPEPTSTTTLREGARILGAVLGDLVHGLILLAWVLATAVGLGAFALGTVLLAIDGDPDGAIAVAVVCGLAWVPLTILGPRRTP